MGWWEGEGRDFFVCFLGPPSPPLASCLFQPHPRGHHTFVCFPPPVLGHCSSQSRWALPIACSSPDADDESFAIDDLAIGPYIRTWPALDTFETVRVSSFLLHSFESATRSAALNVQLICPLCLSHPRALTAGSQTRFPSSEASVARSAPSSVATTSPLVGTFSGRCTSTCLNTRAST